MKKVIKGALYDTDTAKLLGQYQNAEGTGSLQYIGESLYLTRSGKYFIYFEGGALTQYTAVSGDGNDSGQLIRPITPLEAREWAGKRLNGDKYSAIFGEPSEDELEPLHTQISASAKAKLNKLRAQSGKNYREIIEAILSRTDEV